MFPLITPVMNVNLPGSRVNLANTTRADTRLSPTNAIASWEANPDGTARTFAGSSGYINLSGQWRLSGAAADYEIRFTPQSGDAPNGGSTLNTWLALTSLRSISFTNSDNFESEMGGTVLVEIRDAVTLAVLDSATVTLSADVFSSA